MTNASGANRTALGEPGDSGGVLVDFGLRLRGVTSTMTGSADVYLPRDGIVTVVVVVALLTKCGDVVTRSGDVVSRYANVWR